MTIRNRKLATALSRLTLISAFALPLITAAIWLFWKELAPYVLGNLQHIFNIGGLSVNERLIGFTLSLVCVAIQVVGLLSLRQTFLEAAAGNPLSEKAIHGFRRFAWVAFIMVFMAIIQRTGLIALFSLSDPEYQGRIDVQLGTNELKALFMGLLLVFVARVFAEGQRAKDENETFL